MKSKRCRMAQHVIPLLSSNSMFASVISPVKLRRVPAYAQGLATAEEPPALPNRELL